MKLKIKDCIKIVDNIDVFAKFELSKFKEIFKKIKVVKDIAEPYIIKRSSMQNNLNIEFTEAQTDNDKEQVNLKYYKEVESYKKDIEKLTDIEFKIKEKDLPDVSSKDYLFLQDFF